MIRRVAGWLELLRTALFRRPDAESDLAQEVSFHIESRTADLERGGLSRDEALRAARLEFGGVEGYKERCREASGFRPFDELRADLRYAFRTLRQNPVFTAMAVLSLALGIGVNLSMFTSLYYVVLHPFPYPNLDRIMTVSETRAKSGSVRDGVASADYLDWKRSNRSFESLAAYQDWDVNLTGVSQPDHLHAARASAEFFNVLGMNPLRGRTFTAAECESGKDAVVVLSYGFWRTRLASMPNVVGETLSLGSRRYTVIGVMPDEFNLPLSAELWAPLAFTPEQKMQRGRQSLAVIGKLKPGVPKQQAADDLDAIARRLEDEYPETNEDRRALVSSMQEMMQTESDRFVLVLTGAALFVLLLACTNVGSLQIARTMGRQRELGLRSALGAGIFRIVRQLLTEGLVLGLAAGVAGLALAAWDLGISRSQIPVMVYRIVPGLRDMRINGETVLLGVALSVAAGFLCSLPAIFQVVRRGSGSQLNEILKDGGRAAGTSPARSRLRAVLVIAEVALAFVLLVGAGLMVGTFQRMLNVNLGYDPRGVVAGSIALSGSEYQKAARITGFYDALVSNLSRRADLEAVAVSGSLGGAQPVLIEGRSQPRPGELRPSLHAASTGYLKVMKLPLLNGRWLAESDGVDAPRVVVVSEAVARQHWPGTNPVGQRIRLGNAEAPWLTVVGVAGDVHDWFLGNPMPAAYVSSTQFPTASMQVIVRAGGDPQFVAGVLRLAGQALDREQPIFNIQTLRQRILDETSGVRNAARMMMTYAVIALLLAVTGIYSISAFFVVQRTREIGVRMSLGATRAAILRMVLSQSCAMSGLGLMIGLPAAILLTVGMSRALFNVISVDPAVFLGVMTLLGVLAILAGYIPAHRAARVDPLIALRHE